MLQTAVGAFTRWFNAPFAEPFDVVDLFLAVGLVMVMIVVWGRILSHME